ncbi:MAG: nitroreductase [Desulfobacteraceae bacterium]|nr:MAG: nitroreductase [Desulfobacteraceae bacterium]
MTPTSFTDLVKQNRSCRRFDATHVIEMDTLKGLIELARYTASGANMQPLKYILVNHPEKNDAVYQSLGWAAYLKDWKGPGNDEKPTAYIVITGDSTLAKNYWCDHGIAAQTILLSARDQGLAGCMFAAINHKKLRSDLSIDEHLDILLVLALGKPVETAQIDDVGPDGSIKYWRDEQQVHHVPKRGLDELIHATW